MASSPFNILNSELSLTEDLVDAVRVVKESASNELIFAVVGHVGSGTSVIADSLRESLGATTLPGGGYDAHVIKARSVLVDWATKNGFSLRATEDRSMEATERLQDCGDAMRRTELAPGVHDHAAVAKGLIKEIRAIRGQQSRQAISGNTVAPMRVKRAGAAYILDALRHPAEVELLRRVYGDAFIVVGVASEEGARRNRLSAKFMDAGQKKVEDFMKRDAKSDQKYGQRVADTFHLADFFVDNTASRLSRKLEPNPNWNVLERLGRLVKIVSHEGVIPPDVEETAMNHAYAAMMQSACLSRQVGAALLNSDGALIATGTNEVPRAGGGLYGERVALAGRASSMSYSEENRCALRQHQEGHFCSNSREQNEMIEELVRVTVESIAESATISTERLREQFRATRVGGLLEFSRAVHAEMDALLTAGRTGSTTVGSRLFVTTFPCHYCARHIVSSGVDEVQYIEPYPKSLALKLHDDSIQISADGWEPPSKGGKTVLFRPFSGVAPRFYRRAFLKDRELKDRSTGRFSSQDPEWGSQYFLSRFGYQELEEKLAGEEAKR